MCLKYKAKTIYCYLCLMVENLSFNDNYIIWEL